MKLEQAFPTFKSFRGFGVLRSEKKELTSLFIIVLLVGIGIFGGLSIVNTLLGNYSKMGELNKEITFLSNKRQMLEKSKTPNQKSAAILVNALPLKPQAITVINTLRVLSQQYGVEIISVKSVAQDSRKGKTESISTNKIFFELSGPIDGLSSFISKIEETLPFVIITTGDFSSSGGDGKLNMEISTFGKKLPESVPSPESPLSELSSEEKALLAKLEKIGGEVNVQVPTVTSPTPPPVIVPGETGRTNPFSF